MASEIEKYAQEGESWISINETVKTAKLMAKKNLELNRIIEETRTQATGLKEIELPRDKSLSNLEHPLEDLKNTANLLSESGSELVICIEQLIRKSLLFEKLVRLKYGRRGNSPEILAEFCNALEELHDRAKHFSKAYLDFTNHLKKIQEHSNALINAMERGERELKANAGDKKKFGTAAGIATVGLMALGFFTGGAAWVTLGLAGAVGGAVTAGACYKDFSHLNQLANGITKYVGQLGAFTKFLTASRNRCDEYQLDTKAVEALDSALKYFMGEMEEKDTMEKTVNEMIAIRNAEAAMSETEIARRDTEIAKRDAEIAKREAGIAKKETELAKKDAEIAKKDAEIAKKDAEIAKKDAEIAKKDAEIVLKDAVIAKLQNKSK